MLRKQRHLLSENRNRIERVTEIPSIRARFDRFELGNRRA